MTKQTPEPKPKSVGFLARVKKLDVQAGIAILACILFWLLSSLVEPGLLYTLLLIAGAFSVGFAVTRTSLHIVNELINRWEVKLGQTLDRMLRYYSLSKDRGADLFGPKIACRRVEIIVEIAAAPNASVFEYSIKYTLSFLKVLTEPVRFQVLVSPFPVPTGRDPSELYWFPQRVNVAPEDVLTLGLNPIHTGQLEESILAKFATTVRDKIEVFDKLPAEHQESCEPKPGALELVTYGWLDKRDQRENFQMPTSEGWLRRGAEEAVFSVSVHDHPRDGPWLVLAPPTRCTELKIEVRYPEGIEVDLMPYVTGWLFDENRTRVLSYSHDGKVFLSLEIYCKEGAVFAPVDGFHIVVRPGPTSAPHQTAAVNPDDDAPSQ